MDFSCGEIALNFTAASMCQCWWNEIYPAISFGFFFEIMHLKTVYPQCLPLLESLKAGRYLLRSTDPCLLFKWACYSRLPRTMSSWVLSIFIDKLHNLSEQPVPVFNSKKCSRVQMEFHVFQYVPTASCPATGHHWEECVTLFFIPSCQVFRHVVKIPPGPHCSLGQRKLCKTSRICSCRKVLRDL